MSRDAQIFLLKLVGAMLFCMSVLGFGADISLHPERYSRFAQTDKSEIKRLQPAAMAEATYQINAELQRKFKP